MTADELIRKFNDEFGVHNPWPSQFEVDPETYSNCCQAVFDWAVRNKYEIDFHYIGVNNAKVYGIALGPNNGLMFKNIELIKKCQN